MGISTTRKLLLCGAALLTFGLPSAAMAQQRNFDVPAQSATKSIPEFARQAGIQIVAPAGKLRGVRTVPLKGAMDVRAALARLLQGTGLRIVADEGSTITLGPVARESGSAASPQTTSKGSSSQTGEADAGSAAATDESAEIVVTGTNIRGVVNKTQPLTVLDKKYIDSTGYSTSAQLIESIPQNFASGSPSSAGNEGNLLSTVQGSSINLRGVGEGTTLVLLNGRRLPPGFLGATVDVSAFPLSAIERVEVLTDGASAIYGSDAVGGVVNFVLRNDFEGAETRLRYGHAAGGVDEFRAGQTLGTAWKTGNIIVGGEYYHRDLLRASERDFVPAASEIGSLYPKDDNISLIGSANQKLTDALTFSIDGLYTRRHTFNEAGQTSFGFNQTSKLSTFSTGAGLEWKIGRWRLTASGNYGSSQVNQVQIYSAFNINSTINSEYQTRMGELKLDGPLLTLPGGDASVAIGADWRRDTLLVAGASNIRGEQTIKSAFGELSVPIFGPGNAVPGVEALQVSAAARYDSYSSFGSSLDPRIGLMWEPVSGLRLRTSYGTSYVAPRLSDLYTGSNAATVRFTADPGRNGAISYVMVVRGTDVASLGPQRSKSFSAGLDFIPKSIPNLSFSANYFQIKYKDRIENPPPDSAFVFANPAVFGSLITRNPSVTFVNDLIAYARTGTGVIARNASGGINTTFTPDQVNVVIDLRRRNLAVVETKGLDASLSYKFNGFGGEFSAGATATYIFKSEKQLTAVSAPLSAVDTVFNPPRWRGRFSLGWRAGGFAANLFVDHKDSYEDNRFTPSRAISSYTTADVRVAYDFGGESKRGPLQGLTLALSIQNLFDRDPPPIAVTDVSRDEGFDPTNANPMGRLIGIELIKKW